MTRVMAQGTFDLLHPGHIHYLRESGGLGDELYVVIARDSRISEDKSVAMDEESRRIIIDNLKPVKAAILGSEESIYDSVERLQPDIITIGHDQPFDADELEDTLREKGFDGIRVIRISAYDGEVSSSTELRERVRSQDG